MHYKDRPISLDTPMRTDLLQSDEKMIDTTMKKQIALILYFLSSPDDVFFPHRTIAVIGALRKKFPVLSSPKMKLQEIIQLVPV